MEYDLTKQLCTYLDAHLMLPLVEFVKGYPEEQINKAKADILAQTGCCDYAMTVYQTIGRDTAPLQQKKQQLVEELSKLKKECTVITQYLETKKEPVKKPSEAKSVEDGEDTIAEGETTSRPSQSENLSQLKEKVTPAIIESLYHLAKVLFETGDYGAARDYLEVFTKLSGDKEKIVSALWGILESDILSLNWVSAVGDIAPLKEEIDSNHGQEPLKQLYQRAWLIHRSLFVYFNHTESRSFLVDLLLDEKYLNAIQTICPHILRYLAVSVITNRRKQQSLFQLVKVIEQEAYTYKDPVTLFISSLYVRFDFEEAHQHLVECEKVLTNDFFLVNCLNDFMENARACIFETYCNIHENIDIDMLCKNLGINSESSEKWIVEAIRNARFVAKIDSANNQIKMFSQHTNAYRQVMDKTKGLFNRGIEILVGINDSRTQQSRKNLQQNKDKDGKEDRSKGQQGSRADSRQPRQPRQDSKQQQDNAVTV